MLIDRVNPNHSASTAVCMARCRNGPHRATPGTDRYGNHGGRSL